MINILENDASAARPTGSMESTLIWMQHNCPMGVKRSAELHRLLNIRQAKDFPYFEYDIPDVKGIDISVY